VAVLIFLQTEVNRMKPFITPKVTEDGKKLLEFQYEGGTLKSISKTIDQRKIVAYALPAGQSLNEAWEFQLHFNEGLLVEFSSAYEDVITECGIIFCGRGGSEIIISAGVSPGSVSVSAPFSLDSFEPQFSLASCRREAIGYPDA
nr:hypothetical protein [Tanacetum cinerariifolium]